MQKAEHLRVSFLPSHRSIVVFVTFFFNEITQKFLLKNYDRTVHVRTLIVLNIYFVLKYLHMTTVKLPGFLVLF